jgi:hypothetical protein
MRHYRLLPPLTITLHFVYTSVTAIITEIIRSYAVPSIRRRLLQKEKASMVVFRAIESVVWSLSVVIRRTGGSLSFIWLENEARAY